MYNNTSREMNKTRSPTCFCADLGGGQILGSFLLELRNRKRQEAESW